MTRNKADEHFLFTVVIIVAMAVGILGFFCGEDLLMSCFDILNKITSWMRRGIFVLFTLILCLPGILFLLASWRLEDQKDAQEAEWHFISSLDKTNAKTELSPYKKLMFDEKVSSIEEGMLVNLSNLRAVEFYSNIAIKKRAFGQCKNLQEVSFYQMPAELNSDAFIGCTNLAVVNFCGSKRAWAEFGVRLPKDCKVNYDFFTTAMIQAGETSKAREKNEYTIKVDKTITVNINNQSKE